MKIWIDAQISPAIAVWIHAKFSIEAKPLRELGLRDADDETIYSRAKSENVIVMTKDSDFVRLYDHCGSPRK